LVDGLPLLIFPGETKMNLDMIEHGLVISVSFTEADDFDNGPVLAAINALVEALKDCEEVSVSISSVFDADTDEVLEYMQNEYAIDQDEDEEDALSDQDAEDESEDEHSDEPKEDDLH
jgi:hypothetical protein